MHIENEEGERDGDTSVVVEVGSLPTGTQFPLSSLIKAAPYYDTVLNPVQTHALIEELNLSLRTGTGISHAHLLELAKQALKPHTYLRSTGDYKQ